MENEEIELMPSGLVAGFLDEKEVPILKISPKKLTIRVLDEIEGKPQLKIAFYIFKECRYEEVIINEYIIEKQTKEEFYFTYVIAINNNEYFVNVRNIFNDYSRYARNKAFGEDNEFSNEMVGYPYELDYDFYESFYEQKKELVENIDYSNWNGGNLHKVELAIKLDNYYLYNKYIGKTIDVFKEEYLQENFVEEHKLFNKEISRLYIGNEFCHNLFPKTGLLMKIINKAKVEKLKLTICFTYIRECYIENTREIINKLYNWCKENNYKIEIVVNDWGMVKLIEDKGDYIEPILGVLLNKRKKDPRYMYKNGYAENKELIAENSLNSKVFSEFLSECNISRYEYESCGYKMDIAKGKHSIHMPFYVTNTSQYCPLYAKCTTMDRGKQKLIKDCKMYCSEYVFSYAKHLKMVGVYNSLFAFDDTLIKDSKIFDFYINSGIDRIVLNFFSL